MNLIKYQAFIKTIELGSITKAAQALGYSQPGISHMLDSLEQEIGFPLLIRSKESIRPTDNGKEILYFCQQIVKNEAALRDTASSIKGLLSGTIQIGAFNSTLVSFVPQLISGFSQAYSKIDIHIQEGSWSELNRDLANGTIDLAFMSAPVPKGFEFRPLFHDAYCLVMHSGHPLAFYERIPVRLLNGCDFIMPVPGWDDIVKHIMAQTPFTPNITHYTASDTAGIAMAAENLGVYITSTLQAGRLPSNAAAREFEGDFGRTIGIGLKSLKHASPAVKEFVRLAEQRYTS